MQRTENWIKTIFNRIRNKRKSRAQVAKETITSSGQTRKNRIAENATSTQDYNIQDQSTIQVSETNKSQLSRKSSSEPLSRKKN